MIELYANNAYSTVAATLTSSASTMSVATGTGSKFPNPTAGSQFFRLTLTSASSPNTIFEIVYCISRSGDVLTLQRGQEGTTAQTWSIGDLCGNVPTKGMLNQFVQPWIGVDSNNVSDTYVVYTPQHETAYYMGMPCTFSTLNANITSTPTLNLNGLGTAVIKNGNGAALAVGQIPANTPISVQYDTYDGSWRMISSMGVATSLTPSKAVVSDPYGVITTADPSVTQINYLSNWIQNLTSLNTQPGYLSLPSGLVIQWGSSNCSSQVTTAVFPVAFNHSCLAAYAVEGFGQPPSSAHQPTWYGVDSNTFTTTSMSIYALEWNASTKVWAYPTSGTSIACNWIAIGY